MPALHGFLRRFDRQLFAVDAYAAGIGRGDAKQRQRHVGAARAHKAGKTQHLAGANVESDI